MGQPKQVYTSTYSRINECMHVRMICRRSSSNHQLESLAYSKTNVGPLHSLIAVDFRRWWWCFHTYYLTQSLAVSETFHLANFNWLNLSQTWTDVDNYLYRFNFDDLINSSYWGNWEFVCIRRIAFVWNCFCSYTMRQWAKCQGDFSKLSMNDLSCNFEHTFVRIFNSMSIWFNSIQFKDTNLDHFNKPIPNMDTKSSQWRF